METEEGCVDRREYPARRADWFDGGVTFTKAYAVRLRAALEDKPFDEDRDERLHPKE